MKTQGGGGQVTSCEICMRPVCVCVEWEIFRLEADKPLQLINSVFDTLAWCSFSSNIAHIANKWDQSARWNWSRMANSRIKSDIGITNRSETTKPLNNGEKYSEQSNIRSKWNDAKATERSDRCKVEANRSNSSPMSAGEGRGEEVRERPMKNATHGIQNFGKPKRNYTE